MGYEEGYKQLCRYMTKAAVSDIRMYVDKVRNNEKISNGLKRDFKSAKKWIFSDENTKYAYSFSKICFLLELDLDAVREKITKDLEDIV